MLYDLHPQMKRISTIPYSVLLCSQYLNLKHIVLMSDFRRILGTGKMFFATELILHDKRFSDWDFILYFYLYIFIVAITWYSESYVKQNQLKNVQNNDKLSDAILLEGLSQGISYTIYMLTADWLVVV